MLAALTSCPLIVTESCSIYAKAVIAEKQEYYEDDPAGAQIKTARKGKLGSEPTLSSGFLFCLTTQ